MNITETGWEGEGWIQMAYVRVQWWAHGNPVRKFRAS